MLKCKENQSKKCVQTTCIFFDVKEPFEISAFEITRVNCTGTTIIGTE